MDNEIKLSKDGSVHVTNEIFNTTSHMISSMFALLGLVILIVKSSIMGDPWKIIGFSLYGTSLLCMLLCSTFHHGINAGSKIDSFLRLFDYIAIFPLIAGTYTPFCIITLRENSSWVTWGWSIFGVIWFIAIVGIVIKAVFPAVPKWVTNAIYVGMGWVGAVLIIPIFKILGWEASVLVVLGGLFYTIGSFIFYMEKPNPIIGKFGFHEIWHIFVILGGLSHFIVMYFYVL
ncbi:MAG: hypothetical protein A2015_10440 [Spirochaetes bacterium GWF1_31_7]|nr:MAG: hypothetical protein A2Y30_16180 [Spirochaetes bacterium GWE1_32_154]OHD48517.1 MAG: hypothetical protein A2Y29_14155 [Spirochaetes bacterium GWE2_31_10]OHD51431.1 MAG: hypothetical protein A2015_10440 [Spirochaetes bacterium GWF1_31_7]OHD75298.1 MAG: hypothetical protein A2355_16340 [Spirochaetes bacterium RIFOXYB1_FULL_32_8]HBD93354.1 hemolysin III [Spirochaetia bacterium]